MQSKHSEHGSPYLTTCHFTFTFKSNMVNDSSTVCAFFTKTNLADFCGSLNVITKLVKTCLSLCFEHQVLVKWTFSGGTELSV